MKVVGRFRASCSQESMWFLNDLLTDRPVYNVPELYEIRGPLDRSSFERAAAGLVARHEPLRTTFELDGLSLMQVVWDEIGQTVEWREIGAEVGDDYLNEIIRAEMDRPFNLGAGPLIRITVLCRSDVEYVLLMNFHHIIVDLRSIEIIQRDLSELYEAELAGRKAVLPDLAVQYADFAVWQRGWLEGSESRRQIEWWTAKLAGYKAADLPLVQLRTVAPTYRNQIFEFDVPSEVVFGLRALAKDSQATLYMVMLAAFQVVLRTYTGSDDQIVGGLMAGRTVPEVANTVGFFVNTIPIRTDLSGDPTFIQLLHRVRDTAVDAYDCQDLPFEEIVKLLAPRRRGTRNPFFDVLFHLHQMTTRTDSVPATSLELTGLAVRQPARRSRLSFFDLELRLEERHDRITVAVVFRTELFDLPYIEQLTSCYLSVLTHAGRTPRARISELSVVDDAANQVLEQWSTGPAVSWPERTIVDLVEDVIRVRPDDVAVVFGTHQMSYRQLDARSDAIVGFLRERGIGRGSIVAVCCHRGLELVVGMWAVLRSGATLLPLDPTYPVARLSACLHAAGARLVLGTDSRFLEGEQEPGDVQWVGISSLLAAESSGSLPARPRIEPADTAYVIFTSGSTGVPKAVAMPHGALHNLIAWGVSDITDGGGVFSAFASIGFDVSLQEIFEALASGGRVVMTSQEDRHEPALLFDLLRRERVRWAHLPPKVVAALCDSAIAKAVPLPTVMGVISAGERLGLTPGIRAVLAENRRMRLINQYGPAETHWATTYRLPEVVSRWPDDPPIGRPIANVQVHILSDSLARLPVGVPGEIWVGGAGVASGYLGDSRATAEKFVPDPYGQPGARLYRTGDRGRWLPGGDLAYLGRVDGQVKIRGFRVEPAEIALELLKSDRVRDVLVQAVESHGEPRLVAFFVRRPEGVADDEDDVLALRSYLESRLPGYLVPASFVGVDELPRNANGKVDLAMLQAVPPLDRATGHVVPATALEREIAGLWEEMLGAARIGRYDNFFELGGHSLLAMMVVSRLSALLKRDVSVRDLFMAPTVADLAARL